MPGNEQLRFDIDKAAPVVPAAERLAGFRRVFELTAVKNFREDLKDLPPVVERKLGSLMTRDSVTMYGTEIVIPHPLPSAEG